jgi:hypothetical protein
LLLLRRPILAGFLLGLALCLKPQLAIAFPLLLLIDRRWTVLSATILTFAFTALLSAALFGSSAWVEWARSLPAFLSLHEATAVLRRNEIAQGLPLWLRALAVIAGAWAGAKALRRGKPVEAFVLAAGTELIGSAHAMGYEFAMFAAAAPALIAGRKWSASAIIVFLMVPGFIWFGLPPFPFRLLALLLLLVAAAVDGLFSRPRDAELASAARPHDNAADMVKEPAG